VTPLERQFELKKKGITQKAIAEELGVAQMIVSKVINGQMVSDRVMRAVAAAMHLDHRYVFAEYYFGPKRRATSKVASQ
jgi:transcriptional regulator with XRE-family HTH domain